MRKTLPAREIVFIDSRLAASQELADGVAGGLACVLASTQHPLAQIADALERLGPFDAVHIVAHGAPGELHFSAGVVSCATLEREAADLRRIGAALPPQADVLLWACEVGRGARGERFLDALAAATGADVAAATHPVGNSALGGRWTLDAATGPVGASVPFTAAAVAAFTGMLPAGPDTGEFNVNAPSAATNEQGAVIATLDGPGSLATDGFVVIYQTQDTAAGQGLDLDLVAQRFDANGNPVGQNGTTPGLAPFTIADSNDGSDASYFNPHVFGLPNGGFLVTYERFDLVGVNDIDVFGVVVQANGTIGTPFQISSADTLPGGETQDQPSTAAFADGSFVVAFRRFTDFDSETAEIFARRFNSAGAPLGAEFQVNTSADDEQKQPQVAPLADGGFLVVWASDLDAGAAFNVEIRAQRYNSAGQAVNADGTTLGAQEFTINTTGTGNQDAPHVTALVGDGWVVTWHSNTGSDPNVFARVYNSSGVAVSGEIQVPTSAAGPQNVPTVTALRDGGFLVTFMDTDGGGTADVNGQRFDANGNKVGAEFVVNTTVAGTQQPDQPSSAFITPRADDQAVATVWFGTPTDNLHGRVYTIHSAPEGANNADTILEDTSYTFSALDFPFTDSPFDIGDALGAVVITSLETNGRLLYDPDGPGGAAPVDVTAGQVISIADINAGRLTFVPDANENATPGSYATYTFQVQDDGGTATGSVDLDPTPNSYTLNVTPVNDAPNVVNGTAQSLTAINEDNFTFAGQAVTALFASHFSDVDDDQTAIGGSSANNFAGVAVVGNAATAAQGVWEYSTNGTDWNPVGGGVSDANALLLNPATLLRFVPAANFNGAAPALAVRLVEDTAAAFASGDTRNIGGQIGDPGSYSADTIATSQTINSVNDAPTGADDTLTLVEDNAWTFAAADFGFSDPQDAAGSGGADAFATVIVTTLPLAGALTLSGNPVAAGQPIPVGSIPNLVFTPADNANGAGYASITFQVVDDGGTANGGQNTDQDANTITFDVTAVNDGPALANISGAVTTDEQAAVVLDADAAISDPDLDALNGGNGLYTGASLTVGRQTPDAEDTFGFDIAGALFTMSGSALQSGGQTFATFTSAGGTLTVTFTSSGTAATTALANDVLRRIVYTNTSEAPPASVVLTYVFDDGSPGSGQGTGEPAVAASDKTVNITAIDDPTVAVDDAFATDEATAVNGDVLAANPTTADSDLDDPLTVTELNGVAADVGTQVMLASGALLTLNADGTFTYDPNGAFDFLPTAGSGASNTPGFDAFTYTLDSGGTATVTVTVTGVDSDDILRDVAGVSDTLSGGIGNDWYFVRDVGDVVIEHVGEGTADRVLAAVSYTLADDTDVEFLSLDNNFGANAIDLTGNALANLIYGNEGVNVLSGAGGNDIVHGRGDDDILNGEAGDDALVGGAGDDTLNGGEGNDRLYGEAGQNTLAGGAGDDWYFVASPDDIVVEAAGEGDADRVFTSVSYALTAGAAVEFMSAYPYAGTDPVNLAGNAFAQTIHGNAGSNLLNGGGGLDILFGRAGDDRYVVNNAGVRVFELAGDGHDWVFAGVSYALEAPFEIEVLSTTNTAGTGAIALTGNGFTNVLVGNAGANVLRGLGGDDRLIGGLGNDTLDGGAGVDTADYSATVLGVVVNLGEASNHASGAEIGTDQLIAVENVNGGSGVDILTGNALANRLDGRGGEDGLAGGIGDDSYLVRAAGDIVVELANEGNDWVYAGVNYALGVAAEVETLSTTSHVGTASINLTGSAFAQTIIGNDGANTLNGGGGNDIVHGRGGADVYLFNTALNAASNVVSIVSYVAEDDVIHLDDAVFAGLPAGALAAAAFFAAAGATAGTTSDHRIVYDTTSGALYFDQDGAGADPAVRFATLNGAPAITEAEFFVV